MGTKIDQQAFEQFATLHPHEAYAKWPGRFWKFFKTFYPLTSKKEMVKILKGTAKAFKPHNGNKQMKTLTAKVEVK